MKLNIIIILLVLTILTGCSSLTNVLYGPDLTPQQLLDEIYSDAYAIGTMQAMKPDADIIKLESEARELLGAVDPGEYLQRRWLEAIAKGETESVLIWTAARRIYKRVGAQYVSGVLTVSGVDIDLLKYGVEAYITGLKQTPIKS